MQRQHAGRVLVGGVAGVSLLLLFLATRQHPAGVGAGRGGAGRRGVYLLQQGLSYLGHEQQLARAAQVRRQIKTGVAHGTVGMGIGGSMPVPPPPPPTWSRGGHSWIYDDQYGPGVRPTDSVWCDCNTLAECKEKCGKAEEPEPEPEPDIAEAEEPAEEEQQEPPQEEEPAQDEPAAEAERQPEPAEDVEEPEPEDDTEEEEPAAEEEQEEEPTHESAAEPDDDRQGNGGTGYILTAPYEGYAPKLPPSGRGLPYGGLPPVVAAQPAAPYGAPYALYGAPYGAAGTPGGGYGGGGVDGGMSALLPSSWGGEDAAEHALTLSQWRVNILKSKLQQAHLRKNLMDASAPRAIEAGENEAQRGDEDKDEDEETAEVRRQLAAEGKDARREGENGAPTGALAAQGGAVEAQAAELSGVPSCTAVNARDSARLVCRVANQELRCGGVRWRWQSSRRTWLASRSKR